MPLPTQTWVEMVIALTALAPNLALVKMPYFLLKISSPEAKNTGQ